jgi:ASC-1-like (ASCH) protein
VLKVHYLKTWSEFFYMVRAGLKTAELRLNDRNFADGDVLILQDFDPGSETYSGQEEVVKVTHIVRGGFGLKEGYVLLSYHRVA